jgi:hypothetical protein
MICMPPGTVHSLRLRRRHPRGPRPNLVAQTANTAGSVVVASI